MKVLVVGNGAREHAILWKLKRQNPELSLFVTEGNGGTGRLATAIPIKGAEAGPLAAWAKSEGIDLTIVGPEVPLAEGIVDIFGAHGLRIFGPTKAAAEIESSKAFAKDLMRRNGIPTARFQVFRDLPAAREFIRALGAPVVLKASGLASGKGAVICQTVEEADQVAEEMLTGATFGTAGRELVVEEFMLGEELSVFSICDGEEFVTLPAAQDHKAIGEGDTGPNTGGMGAYSPVSIATPELLARVDREIVGPTLRALYTEGRPYRGFLYTGLMLTEEGPKVVEFNARFGDPEAQVVLPLLESSLLELIEAALDGRLGSTEVAFGAGAAVTTVLASGGYPGSYQTGYEINVPEDLDGSDEVVVFHAGTALKGGRLVTSGGRVLSVTGFGDDVFEAAGRSREAAQRIQFQGRTFRRDIGWREARRLEAGAQIAG